MRNPLVKGRMYKVAEGGPIKGFRVNKSGTVDVLVVPGAKKRNPKKKRPKKKPNRKRKPNRRTKKRGNCKRAAKKKK